MQDLFARIKKVPKDQLVKVMSRLDPFHGPSYFVKLPTRSFRLYVCRWCDENGSEELFRLLKYVRLQTTGQVRVPLWGIP
jgi:hypothetical protein